jgi:sugar lactone lactonase YvrE
MLSQTAQSLPQAQLLVPSHCQVGESLIWNAAEQSLYWVDITGKQLHRYALSTQAHCVWDTLEMTGCIALHAAGGLIAGMESGLFRVTFSALDQALFTKVCDVPHTAPNMRFNDGRTDRQGRLVAGTMTVNQAVGVGNPSVYQYAAEGGELKTLLAGFVQPFTTPNGIAFSPDGRTFYLSDSHASQQRVWAFDYDTASGTPSHRREFIDMNQHAGRPDGAAIDTDGCYWICATDAGMIHRFTPQGKLDYSLTVPVKKPTICTFGGADLRTLYVASIRPDGIDVSDQPLAGGVFAFEGLNAQGVAETAFQSALPF